MKKENIGLSDFVQKEYKRIKGMKKSPKNFDVFMKANSKTYYLEATDLRSGFSSEYVGNLSALFDISKSTIVPPVVTFKEKTAPKVVVSGNIDGFKTEWIPLFKKLLTLDTQMDGYVAYRNLSKEIRDIISKKDYEGIINWLNS